MRDVLMEAITKFRQENGEPEYGKRLKVKICRNCNNVTFDKEELTDCLNCNNSFNDFKHYEDQLENITKAIEYLYQCREK